MKISLPALVLAIAFATHGTSAWSQERYTMKETENGIIRLDTQTGEVSHCSFANEDLICRVAADDRSAYEDEIVRLTEENEALKTESGGSARRPNNELPSEREIQEAMSLFETFTSAFLNSIRNLQRDLEEFESETN